MKRILITGIAGHLGSKLAEWIIVNKPDCHIVGIDNLSSGFYENIPVGVEFAPGSIGHVAAHHPSIFGEPFDAVFHFAAFAAEVLSPHVRQYTIENVWGQTAALLNAILNGPGCQRLVYASSIAVYGRGPFERSKLAQTGIHGGQVEPQAFEESDGCIPNDSYGIAKLASEHDIRVAGEQFGLDWCVVRPHNIYGPGQNLWDRHRNVFGIWMRAALEGKPFTIFGDGLQRRAFSYIDDILPCLWEAAFAPQASKQTVNLGGSEPIEIYRAVEALAFVMGSEGAELKFEPARHETKDAWCSTAKSRELLGYADKTELPTGLEAMWNWARKDWARFPDRRQLREPFDIEMPRGLPGVWRHSGESVAASAAGT
jgi:UDP-glucose 4-epimerase